MTKEETLKIMDKIDVVYQTNYANKENFVYEWHKELKNYDFQDVYNKLEEHMRSNFSSSIPKLYFLTKGLRTPTEKENLKNIRVSCTICKQFIKEAEFDKHFDRCMNIDYIKRNVKKYLNQEINLNDYYLMSDDDIIKRYEKIAKIVMENSKNETEVNSIRKYFETKGVLYEENNQTRHI